MARFSTPTSGAGANLVESSSQFNLTASGTNPTFSDSGLFDVNFALIDTYVEFNIQVDLANALTFGTGQYQVLLPYDAKYNEIFREGMIYDASEDTNYMLTGKVNAGSSIVNLFVSSATEVYGEMTDHSHMVAFEQGTPVTLEASDNFMLSGNYIRL